MASMIVPPKPVKGKWPGPQPFKGGPMPQPAKKPTKMPSAKCPSCGLPLSKCKC